ncbi:response regulator transcription factor [Streptomyces sp. NPDC059455]|uniref:response regulator transcription factor n=1 Tax=Streptomyces sp. NPDC059455 TaxID=3346837 RepID=UPI0036A9A91E
MSDGGAGDGGVSGGAAGDGGAGGPIRVVVVDDQPLVRAGFVMVLDAQPDIDVVGEANDGAEALALLDTVAADVVVMDVRRGRPVSWRTPPWVGRRAATRRRRRSRRPPTPRTTSI